MESTIYNTGVARWRHGEDSRFPGAVLLGPCPVCGTPAIRLDKGDIKCPQPGCTWEVLLTIRPSGGKLVDAVPNWWDSDIQVFQRNGKWTAHSPGHRFAEGFMQCDTPQEAVNRYRQRLARQQQQEQDADNLAQAATQPEMVDQAIKELVGTLTKMFWEMTRPSVLYRPKLTLDGNQWCVLYGGNLQEGVAGFGDTPAAAMTAFDEEWVRHK